MNTLTPRSFCETIYCGIASADALELDRETRRIAFDAVVTDNGESRTYHVEFRGVSSMIKNDWSNRRDPEPTDLIELSVIEIEREPDAWRVWLNPWYLHVIEFRCEAIHLNGAEVVGNGRWMQDGLPSRVAD